MKQIRALFLWFIAAVWLLTGALILGLGLIICPYDRLYKYVRLFFRSLLFILGIRLRVEGYESVDWNKQYLILGNHQSLFDIAVIPSVIPYRFVGIEAAEHFRYPIWGWLIRKWGNIPIERYKLKEAKQSLEIARKQLASGLSIAVLPEGHRTRTGEIGPFKKGPFHLALQTGVDLLPFAIKGLFEVKNRNSWILSPGKVVVRFARPIPYEKYKDMDVDTLKEYVRNIMLDLYAK